MDSNDKYIGRMLDNRYEILELIGMGGMALVYKARCHRLNRYVAIKILKEDLANDDDFRRRFHTESQAVGMLSHPNIVAVYDVSRSDNTEYIVMELIEGITLKQYINRKGLLSWKETLHFTTQVIKALSHAHSRGIIHRDIKPHNIMILKDGSVKVADFGIARLLTMQDTLTQEALGSVHYISPEQAKGGNVDARSDIYSMGVVMYEMLTSRLPFVGESAVSVAIQHISAIPLKPGDLNPDVPKGLEDITMHAMEPDLNLRFTTADEMLRDLEEFRKNPSISFNYAVTPPSERQSQDVVLEDETRVVQNPSITDAQERKIEHPEPPKQRPTKKKLDMTRDEYRAVKTRAANTSTLVGVFIIVIFLLAIVVFMWNYLLKDIFSTEEREQIEIPVFVSRLYQSVIEDEEFREMFNFRPPILIHSDEVEEGYIISQTPRAGTMMDEPISGNKISIDLTVSLGEMPTVHMPSLIDQHFIYAMNELDNLGLELTIIPEVIASDVEPGYVIRTIPEAGEPLARGYSVSIIYSGGLEVRSESVPDLVGRTRSQVESAFRSLDITPIFLSFEDDSPEGTVLFIQSVGEKIDVPATIEVHISSGPPATPEEPDPGETEPPEEPDETEPPDTDETDPPKEPDETDPNNEPDDETEPPDSGDTETTPESPDPDADIEEDP